MPQSIEIKLTPFLNIIRSKIDYQPEIAIICGSGLSNITEQMTDKITIQYHELGADFPHSAVQGHKNELVFGQLGSKKVVAFRGRFHFYEGWTVQQSTLGIRLAAALGVKAIIVTNAAGGLSPEYEVGDVMLIEGHINFLGMTGVNPLIGPNVDAEGPRFPPMNAYDPKLMEQFTDCYNKYATEYGNKKTLRRGCYVGLSGPNYETPQEVQFLRIAGGNSVGMSTVNEVVVAAHTGVKVLGLSLITNSGIGTTEEDKLKPIPNHQEVIDATKESEQFLQQLFAKFVDAVDLSHLQQSQLATIYSPEMLAEEQQSAVAAADEKTCPASGKKGSGCPFTTCPVAKSDTPKCPFHCPVIVSGIIGGLIGAAVAALGLVTYAHAPLIFKKDE